MRSDRFFWGLAMAATTIAVLFSSSPVVADSESAEAANKRILDECQGAFKFKRPTPAEVRTVLNKHKAWFAFYQRKYPFPPEEVRVLDANNMWFENQKALEVQAD